MAAVGRDAVEFSGTTGTEVPIVQDQLMNFGIRKALAAIFNIWVLRFAAADEAKSGYE